MSTWEISKWKIFEYFFKEFEKFCKNWLFYALMKNNLKIICQPVFSFVLFLGTLLKLKIWKWMDLCIRWQICQIIVCHMCFPIGLKISFHDHINTKLLSKIRTKDIFFEEKLLFHCWREHFLKSVYKKMYDKNLPRI